MNRCAMHLLLVWWGPLDDTLHDYDRFSCDALCPANHGLRDLVWILSKHTLNGGELVTEDEEDDLCACNMSL